MISLELQWYIDYLLKGEKFIQNKNGYKDQWIFLPSYMNTNQGYSY